MITISNFYSVGNGVSGMSTARLQTHVARMFETKLDSRGNCNRDKGEIYPLGQGLYFEVKMKVKKRCKGSIYSMSVYVDLAINDKLKRESK